MSFPEYIPGPNNELVPSKPRPTGSYPVSVDFATSASYAETASFTLGYILSASYANFSATASYLLGSIANAVSASWAQVSGHSLTSTSASWADRAGTASYVISASYASTASYFVGSVATASYSLTSSVSVTSISSSYAISSSASATSITASYSLTSSVSVESVSASYALTASYALNGGGGSVSSSYLSGSAATIQRVTLANMVAQAYMVSQYATDVEYATSVDQFPDTDGNSAKWLISINDGTSYKTSEIISIWDPTTNITNFAEVTTNVIGTVPVAMSVNISGDNVRLIANPASGSWTIKSLRFVL